MVLMITSSTEAFNASQNPLSCRRVCDATQSTTSSDLWSSECTTRIRPYRLSTELNALLRPDWLRRASRIKKIQQDKNKKVYESLSKRQESLGVGKTYRCRNPSILDTNNNVDDDTAPGSDGKSKRSWGWKEVYLNVYLVIPTNEYEAKDPTNIIHQLKDGSIVKSTAQQKGIWIEHDQGGWSAEYLNGMTRLELIEDQMSKSGDGLLG